MHTRVYDHTNVICLPTLCDTSFVYACVYSAFSLVYACIYLYTHTNHCKVFHYFVLGALPTMARLRRKSQSGFARQMVLAPGVSSTRPGCLGRRGRSSLSWGSTTTPWKRAIRPEWLRGNRRMKWNERTRPCVRACVLAAPCEHGMIIDVFSAPPTNTKINAASFSCVPPCDTYSSRIERHA